MNIAPPARLRSAAQDTPAQSADFGTLQPQDLRVSFNGTPAVHGNSLSVSKGEAPGLVGESGSGKSVTGLAALGLLAARGPSGGGR